MCDWVGSGKENNLGVPWLALIFPPPPFYIVLQEREGKPTDPVGANLYTRMEKLSGNVFIHKVSKSASLLVYCFTAFFVMINSWRHSTNMFFMDN